MGTRADFYVGRGASAQWVGSVAWSGTPEGICAKGGQPIFDATTEQAFRSAVQRHLQSRTDGTLPEYGWPWPWDSSSNTDYVFAFDGNEVLATRPMATKRTGICRWFNARALRAPRRIPEQTVFPDISSVSCLATDERSGLGLAIGVPLKQAFDMAMQR
jgi:hypothetical protein